MSKSEESDLGETFRLFREKGQEKRRSNLANTVELLEEKGINYVKLSEHHFRLWDYDFWPSTGLWIHRTNRKEKGRGVMNLLAKLDRLKKP